MSYLDRLDLLKLEALELCRQRFSMKVVYKMVHGFSSARCYCRADIAAAPGVRPAHGVGLVVRVTRQCLYLGRGWYLRLSWHLGWVQYEGRATAWGKYPWLGWYFQWGQ